MLYVVDRVAWGCVDTLGVRRGSSNVVAPSDGMRALIVSHGIQIIRVPDGQRLVLAKGKIAAGDADRLAVALQSADRDRWGTRASVCGVPEGRSRKHSRWFG